MTVIMLLSVKMLTIVLTMHVRVTTIIKTMRKSIMMMWGMMIMMMVIKDMDDCFSFTHHEMI